MKTFLIRTSFGNFIIQAETWQTAWSRLTMGSVRETVELTEEQAREWTQTDDYKRQQAARTAC